MRWTTRLTAALAFVALAAATAVAVSFAAEPAGFDAATALVRYEPFEGPLGTGLGAAERLVDRARVDRAVARRLNRDPRTIFRSVRLSTDPTTRVIAITATAAIPAQARALANAYTRELISDSRLQLVERTVEAQRYLRFVLSGRGQGNLSDVRRSSLRQEQRLLDDFLAEVRAGRNPVLVQYAQTRAAPTSRVALLSGLSATVGGLLLALAVGSVMRRTPSDSDADDPSSEHFDGPPSRGRSQTLTGPSS